MKQGKNMLFALLLGVSMLFVSTGCGSDTQDKPKAEKKSGESKTNYKEADETALKYTVANYEYDVPVLYKLSPDKVQKEYMEGDKYFLYFKEGFGETERSTEPVEDLTNPAKFEEIKTEQEDKDFFRDFKNVEDELYIVRFEDLGDRNELIYFVKPWLKQSIENDEVTRSEGAGYLKLQENTNEEWKVQEISGRELLKKGVDTRDKYEIKEKGTVVHALK